MSDDLISSLYPPPPPYFRFFTDENSEKLQQWKLEQLVALDSLEGGEDAQESTTPPGELRFLVPPLPPGGPHYRNYGNLWSFEDKLPSLKEMGLRQLYPEEDATITSKAKIEQLHKLLDSLLLNFLELIGVVSIEPEKFHYKIEDLKLILININHILNSYRPHQSRESLIMLLRRQIEAKRNEISQIENVTSGVKTKITSLLQNLSNIDDPIDLSQDDLSKSTKLKVEKDRIIENLLSSI